MPKKSSIYRFLRRHAFADTLSSCLVCSRLLVLWGVLWVMLGMTGLSAASTPSPHADDMLLEPEEDPRTVIAIKEILGAMPRQKIRDVYARFTTESTMLPQLFQGKITAASLQVTEEERALMQLLAVQDPRLYDRFLFPNTAVLVDLNTLGKDLLDHLIRFKILPIHHVIYQISETTFDTALTYLGKDSLQSPTGLHLIGVDAGTFVRPVSVLQLLTRFCWDGEGLHLSVVDDYQSSRIRVQAVLSLLLKSFEKKKLEKLRTLHLNFPYEQRYQENKLRLSQEGEIVAGILIRVSKQLEKMTSVSLFFNFINDRDQTFPQPIWVRIEKFPVSPAQFLNQPLLAKQGKDKGADPVPLSHYRIASPLGFTETENFQKAAQAIKSIVKMLDNRAYEFERRRREKADTGASRFTLSKRAAAMTPTPTLKPEEKQGFCPIDRLDDLPLMGVIPRENALRFEINPSQKRDASAEKEADTLGEQPVPGFAPLPAASSVGSTPLSSVTRPQNTQETDEKNGAFQDAIAAM